MKRVLSIVLFLIMAFGITAGFGGVGSSVYGDIGDDGDFWGYAVDGGYMITGYMGEDAEVVIPSTIDGHTVTQIDSYAFYYNDNITSVVIPDSVTTIGNSAFDGDCNLASITMPSSVTSIGKNVLRDTAYYNEDSNWEDGVLYGGSALIATKDSLEGTYKIKEGTTVVAKGAFENCENLTSLVLPSSLKHLNTPGISCKSLESIEVDSGNGAFTSVDGVLLNKDKTKLIQYPAANERTSYAVPSTVNKIDQSAFEFAKNLEKVTVPDSVTSIGAYAFWKCENLIDITLPDSLQFIGGGAFQNTGYYLDDSNWEDDVLYIGSALVEFSPAITGYYQVKDGTTILAESCGPGNNGLTGLVIPGSVKYIDDDAFYSCTGIKSLSIGEGTTFIGDYAFYYCTGLTDISLPQSLTYIGNGAFLFTGYYETNDNWQDDGLYIGTALVEGGTELDKDYQIIDGTTVVGAGVFAHTEGMTSVTFPESVKVISEGTLNIDSIQSVKVKAADCNIADSAGTITSGATIYGVAGSTAYDYAKKYDRTFKCLTHTYKDKLTKATTSKAGEIKQVCSVCGETGKVTAISSPKEVILSAKNYTYNGKVKKPTVTVKDSTGKTIDKSNYTVKYSSGLKKVGTYKVTVTFKGNYSGSLTATYKINPKGTSLTKMYKRSKGFTAMWKKQGTQTTGYQVQYSTSSNFTDAKTVGVSKTSQISKRVTGLKGKTKYYVRVRTYKTVNGVKYYSGWSKAKSVTTYK